jgi:hypothetical protein
MKKINLLFPIAFGKAFFDSLDAPDVRDRVCNIMESNCTETLQFNNLTVDGCKKAYDKLNMTENGYLDGNTKGCRLLYSSFVPRNTGHCPHLSFAPQEDEKGQIKCQTSRERNSSDLFSSEELEIIREKGELLGFPTNLTRSCTTLTPVQNCLFALNNSGFNLLLTENFTQWMDNETTFEMPETGVRKLYMDITILVTIEQQPTSHSCSSSLLLCTTKGI